MRRDCETCKHDEFGEKYCDDCYCGDPPTKWEASDYYEPDTNAERIRNMTNEKLAYMLFEIDSRKSYTELDGWLKWLEQPAE